MNEVNGWTDIKVSEFRPEDQPEPAPVCPTGWKNHTWRLSIEEGYVSFSPVEPCAKDEYGVLVCDWPEAHQYESETIAIVKMEFATDCPGSGWRESGWHYISHPDHCDCNRWVQVTPVKEIDNE